MSQPIHKWKWVLAAVVVVVGLTLLGRQKASGPTVSSTITIGVVVPLSGDSAEYGLAEQKAASLAVEEINAKGGIGGRQLAVVYEDGKCDGQEAANAIKKLIAYNNVHYVFGGACSSETLGMAPIAESSKVVLLSPSSMSSSVSTAGDYIFRTAPSDVLAAKVAGEYAAKKMKAKTAAIIAEQNEYAQQLRSAFKEVFLQNGGRVVADEIFQANDKDLRTQALKVKNAKPDVLYIVPKTPATGVWVLKQLKIAKVLTPLLSTDVMIGRDAVKQSGKDIEGLIGIEQSYDVKNPDTAKFIKNYAARYKDANGKSEELSFPTYQANMYSQFYLLKEAIGHVGDDPSAVKDYLYTVKDWPHALGKLTFDKNGDAITDYAIEKVVKGELVLVEKYRLGQ